MREPRLRQPTAQHLDRRLMRDMAQRDEHPCGRHRIGLRLEERPTGADFLRRRLVLGRQALHRVEDDRAVQRQPVLGLRAVRAGGQPEPPERLVQELPRIIAGERAAGPVRAVLAGCQADDAEPRRRIAERRDRRVPPGRELGPQLLAHRDEARAERAVMRRLGLGQRGDGREDGRDVDLVCRVDRGVGKLGGVRCGIHRSALGLSLIHISEPTRPY